MNMNMNMNTNMDMDMRCTCTRASHPLATHSARPRLEGRQKGHYVSWRPQSARAPAEALPPARPRTALPTSVVVLGTSNATWRDGNDGAPADPPPLAASGSASRDTLLFFRHAIRAFRVSFRE